ncbi:hypothetical protein BH11PSE9_BH11PSE9_02660 [soil metagenome]
MRTVRFHDEARIEFVGRVAYYEEIERGLGARFQAAVEKAVALAIAMPFAGSPHKHGTRRVFPKKFPFGIVYIVQDEEIVIFAVAHFKLKPGYWRSRTKSDS